MRTSRSKSVLIVPWFASSHVCNVEIAWWLHNLYYYGVRLLGKSRYLLLIAFHLTLLTVVVWV